MESVVTRGRKRDDANLFRLFAAFLAVGGLFWFSCCWGWVSLALFPLYCGSVQDLLRLAIAVCAPYVASFVFSFGFVHAIGRLPKKGYIYIAGGLCVFVALLKMVFFLNRFYVIGQINPALVPSVLVQETVCKCLKLFSVHPMSLFLFLTGVLTSKNNKQWGMLAALVFLGSYADRYIRSFILGLPLWLPPLCAFWLWVAIHAILTIVAVVVLTSSSKDTA